MKLRARRQIQNLRHIILSRKLGVFKSTVFQRAGARHLATKYTTLEGLTMHCLICSLWDVPVLSSSRTLRTWTEGEMQDERTETGIQKGLIIILYSVYLMLFQTSRIQFYFPPIRNRLKYPRPVKPIFFSTECPLPFVPKHSSSTA